MPRADERPKPTLWILKLHDALVGDHDGQLLYYFLSSVLLCMPFWFSGILISYETNQDIFTLGVVSALLWLSIAPFLMRMIYDLFVDTVQKVNSHLLRVGISVSEELKTVQSSKNLCFGIPISVISVYIMSKTIYSQSPAILNVWIVITFSFLFINAGIGFWGVFASGHLINKILQAGPEINLLHPDKLGGLEILNILQLKIVAAFYSGSLLFFIAFDVLRRHFRSQLEWSALAVTLLFILFGITTYMITNYKIKKVLWQKREGKLLESEEKLNELMGFKPGGSGNSRPSDLLKAYLYFTCYHNRIIERRFPLLDTDFVLKVIPASLSPLIVFLKEFYFRP